MKAAMVMRDGNQIVVYEMTTDEAFSVACAMIGSVLKGPVSNDVTFEIMAALMDDPWTDDGQKPKENEDFVKLLSKCPSGSMLIQTAKLMKHEKDIAKVIEEIESGKRSRKS